MRTPKTRKAKKSGHALMLVMITTAVALATLGATMQWNSSNSNLNDRNNHFFSAVAAAEAATEKAISDVSGDYYKGGPARVTKRLKSYSKSIPTRGENPYWANYTFQSMDGSDNRLDVVQTTPWAVVPLVSQYEGLSGYASTFRISAAATDIASRHGVVGAVEQEVQLATIPLFQFAIFYGLDLEVNPGPEMVVGGRVHSNREMYLRPGNSLIFQDNVTASEEIHYGESHPDDPRSGSPGTLEFEGDHDSGVSTLNLPLGVENTPDNTREILYPPPMTERSSSPMGQQRFYNNSDLVIVVSDPPTGLTEPTVSVTGHSSSGSSFGMSYDDISSFVTLTNASFYNPREGKQVKAVEIDVAKLRSWSSAGNNLTTSLGRDVSSVYVADVRSQSVDTQPGVRLVNGQQLPDDGLTVTTPNPLYVQGNYNAPPAALGTTDTSQTKPAALIGDAVNILSSNWKDANSYKGLDSRTAASTTVNAAILAGIVETTPGSYSGGVENYPRFLENWSGKTLTYNGSMVVLFPSAQAVGTWKGTGSYYGIYNPPRRDWHFDKNFLDPSKLPPLTPMVVSVIRADYRVAAR